MVSPKIRPSICLDLCQTDAHLSMSPCGCLLLSDKTIKLWKISERDKRAEGYNLKDEDGRLREPFRLTSLRVRWAVLDIFCYIFKILHFVFFPEHWRARYALQVPVLMPMDLMVEASPRRIFANAHTYHINSISVNSDHETYLSADDLRINLWHLEITDRSFSILFLSIKQLIQTMLLFRQ